MRNNDKEYLAILTSKGCYECAKLKSALKKKIDAGEIAELDINEDTTASEIYRLLDINEVPSLISFTEDEVCLLDDNTLSAIKCIVKK